MKLFPVFLIFILTIISFCLFNCSAYFRQERIKAIDSKSGGTKKYSVDIMIIKEDIVYPAARKEIIDKRDERAFSEKNKIIEKMTSFLMGTDQFRSVRFVNEKEEKKGDIYIKLKLTYLADNNSLGGFLWAAFTACTLYIIPSKEVIHMNYSAEVTNSRSGAKDKYDFDDSYTVWYSIFLLPYSAYKWDSRKDVEGRIEKNMIDNLVMKMKKDGII